MTVITKKEKKDIGPKKMSISTRFIFLFTVQTLIVSAFMLHCAGTRMRQLHAKKLLMRGFTCGKESEEVEVGNDWGDELEEFEGELL